MSDSFDSQFHIRIAHYGQRSVWSAAPLPETLLPQKTALYRTWRTDECRRLQARGDVVLSHSRGAMSSLASPTIAPACA